MNIAVVTVYDGLNFGSYLQAFAMKHFLEEQGHQVFFVQRLSEEENLELFTANRSEDDCGRIKKIWRAFLKIHRRKKVQRTNEYYRKQFPYFQNAWRQLDLRSSDQLGDIDCIICGSDEIWNLNNENLDVPFYASMGYGQGITKLAVAVSVGNSTREDYSKYPQLENAFRSFTEIIVRDEQSREVMENIVGHKVEMVCDPTLLVDKKIFRTKESSELMEEKYLFIYTYGLTEAQSKIVSEFAKRNHYCIVSACTNLSIADRAVYTSPLELARFIAGAECCVTTTFHGTIFCLLFAKRFCTVANYPKIKDLVLNAKADCHLWDGVSKGRFEEIMDNKVDREQLDKCLEEWKQRSSAVIDRALTRAANATEVSKGLLPL